jgi:hypothetical protein
VNPELTKPGFSTPPPATTPKCRTRRVYIHLHCNFACNSCTTGIVNIATMDILLSPSPLPELSLAEASLSMPLPPEAIYGSKEELYTSIQAWAAQYGYAFCIGRSNKIHNGPRIKIFYNCDRCGPPPPEIHPQHYLQPRKRQTTTRKQVVSSQ